MNKKDVMCGWQDLRGLVQSGDHTAQALQGLTFGGNSDGIGIGLGMLQQQAHAGNNMPFQFNKQVIHYAPNGTWKALCCFREVQEHFMQLWRRFICAAWVCNEGEHAST